VTNDNDSTSAAALVAIDIAKVKNDIVIELPGKRRRRRMKELWSNLVYADEIKRRPGSVDRSLLR
jgi:hypothetical protein